MRRGCCHHHVAVNGSEGCGVCISHQGAHSGGAVAWRVVQGCRLLAKGSGVAVPCPLHQAARSAPRTCGDLHQVRPRDEGASGQFHRGSAEVHSGLGAGVARARAEGRSGDREAHHQDVAHLGADQPGKGGLVEGLRRCGDPSLRHHAEPPAAGASVRPPQPSEPAGLFARRHGARCRGGHDGLPAVCALEGAAAERLGAAHGAPPHEQPHGERRARQGFHAGAERDFRHARALRSKGLRHRHPGPRGGRAAAHAVHADGHPGGQGIAPVMRLHCHADPAAAGPARGLGQRQHVAWLHARVAAHLRQPISGRCSSLGDLADVAARGCAGAASGLEDTPARFRRQATRWRRCAARSSVVAVTPEEPAAG
mmetsp:Transcript_76917/g.220230  ORF Transcript_76917/g.220230 Transcript_76917/m.220230 type:complete len:368 (+) Transcript_76917:2663-3766(+)